MLTILPSLRSIRTPLAALLVGGLVVGILGTHWPNAADAKGATHAAKGNLAHPATDGGRNFGSFVADLWPDAQRAGVSRDTFDAAFRGVTFDPKVAALTTRQSEFNRAIGDYVEGAASGRQVARGREAASQWGSALSGIESQYGVPSEVVLAVWGMESSFGGNTGNLSVIRSLATLASLRFRGDLFRNELLDALRILEEGHMPPDRLRGSWAGAMGQTQFMPSSFLLYAVDGDGDGRRDIWTSVPDALASTANFLRQKGWQPGQPWVQEVAIPGTLDLRSHRRPYAEWASLGVQRTDGQALPSGGAASLFMPAGVAGPAFLLGDNFTVIRAYNSSDAYALGVGLLANRIGGAGGTARAWPAAGALLSKGEREEVQKRLAQRGFYQGEADGRHGAKTRDAIREFQISAGLTADGYADAAVLKALRGSK